MSFMKNMMLAIAISAISFPAMAEKRDLVDVVGRKVVVDIPVKRAIIGMYIEDALAVGGPDMLRNVAGISAGTMRDWNAGKWQIYSTKLPALAGIPDMGEIEAGTFSLEKVVAAKPDVVILAAWQADSLGANLEKLSAAGIPVVVVDYNSQTLERHRTSTLLFGELFGTQARAQVLADEYAAAVADVSARIAKIQGPKPRVYLELGNKGPAQYGNSYGKAMWAQLLDVAGADNIARDKIGNWGPLTAESVLAARPEHIFISGGDWPGNNVALRMGFGIKEGDARAKLAEFEARAGWSDLPAVKSRNLHAVSQSMIRSLHDYTQLQFIAKTLHPDAFRDVDPQANLVRFYKTYLPVEPLGIFMAKGQ